MDKTELGCLRAIVLFNPGNGPPLFSEEKDSPRSRPALSRPAEFQMVEHLKGFRFKGVEKVCPSHRDNCGKSLHLSLRFAAAPVGTVAWHWADGQRTCCL